MPTVTDVETVAKPLGSIVASQPQHHGALTVIPILAPTQAKPEWLTLAEAGIACASPALLLLDGGQLVGAK